MTPRRPTALTALALLSILFTLAPATAAACDCSCSALTKLQAGVVSFERQLDRGHDASMTLELQSQLACLESCAERWMICPVMIDGLTGDPLERAAPPPEPVEDQAVNFEAG